VTAAVLSLLVAAGSVAGFVFIVYADNKLRDHVLQPEDTAAIDTPCDPVCTYLLLGSDTRLGLSPEEQALHGDENTVEGERADTIILVHIDPDREKAVVLHFPRDLWVDIPGRDPYKINSAFEGGPNLVVRTIESLTGIEINHYVGISLAGFENTVDALDGVDICVDRPMSDEFANLNLPAAGCYDMDGKTALAFVRARHVEGDCIPDFSRISRQQQFLRAVLGKLLSPAVIPRLPSLIESTASNFTLDHGLHLYDLVSLTNELKGVGTGAVDFRAVPSTPGWELDHTVSVVHMDPAAETLFRRIREGRPLGTVGERLPGTTISPAIVRVRVIDDASGQKAGKVEGFLQDAGFATLGVTEDVPPSLRGPVILFRPGQEEAAQVVQRYLPALELQEAGEGVLSVADVAVVIDATYRGAGVGGGGPAPSPTPPPAEAGC
jgi:LCP family protein required for cell wall assembly